MKYQILTLSIVISMISLSCRENLKILAGGFTKENEIGMALFEFEEEAGSLRRTDMIDAGPSPAWIIHSKSSNLIYALNEVNNFNGHKGGGITTLQYDPDSVSFRKAGEIRVPTGGPCHFSFSPDSGFLLVANYGGGSVAVVKLDDSGIPVAVTDTIIFETDTAQYSHPHMIGPDPAGRHIWLTDLGLDRIVMFDLDTASGQLKLCENGITTLPRGSGPRHFAFNANGSVLYVINELTSEIMVFKVSLEGSLSLQQTISTLSEEFKEKNSCAGIVMGRKGDFLYGSNRGENTIVTFRIGNDGLISFAGRTPCGGNWPRNFAIDPSGNYLFCGNQRSDGIAVFKIDRETGIPSQVPAETKMKAPASIVFLNEVTY